VRAATVGGIGTALPTSVVTNDDLSLILDTDDEWIRERTGIEERRVASPDESTVTLGAAAATAALTDASRTVDDVDLVIVATVTPPTHLPGDAARLQHVLGLRCGGFDVNGACAGFVHALAAASAHVMAGSAECVLVVGAETLTRVVDPQDRSTAVLFGDGAGAAVVIAGPGGDDEPGLLAWNAGCDGEAEGILRIPPGQQYVEMEGREVFRRAVRAMVSSSRAALERAKLSPDDVDLFVPHQANARIVTATADRLGIEPGRTVLSVAHTGNTSAASIPIALRQALDTGRLAGGDLVLLTAVGAGLSWASAVVRWAGP
jgi:3-oxoacyl-[acyl-carrier-protein] synthase-3